MSGGRTLASAWVLLCVGLLWFEAVAQEPGDIPPPDQLESVEDEERIPLEITQPANGATVETPFTVEGRAAPGAQLELWLGDELERVFRANSSGRFTTPVDDRVSKAPKISIHQVGDRGRRVQSASVTVTWAGEGKRKAPSTLDEPELVGKPPEPSRVPDPPAPDAESPEDPEPPTPDPEPEGIPVTEDVDLDTLQAPPPPPPPEGDTEGGIDPFSEADTETDDAGDDSARVTATQTRSETVSEYRTRRRTPGRAERYFAEVGLGLGAAFVGGAAGALLGLGLGASAGAFFPGVFAALGGLAGWSIGIPVGVVFAGHLMDGNGNWWAAVLGEAAGFGLSALVSALFVNSTGAETAVALIAFPILGAAGGYELSSDDSRREAEAAQGSRAIRPVIAPTEDGAVLGLRVRF